MPLDAQGWADAVEAARALSPMGLAAVYAGPLRRTINTAQVIADECRIPTCASCTARQPRLRRVGGHDVGRSRDVRPRGLRPIQEAPQEAVCPNGERLTDARKRMVEAITLIGERRR